MMLRAALLLLLVGCSSVQGLVLGWKTFCSPGCNSTSVSNGMCDFMCMTANCDYDGLDCKPNSMGGVSILASVREIVAAYDVNGDGVLNSTEFSQRYLAQSPPFAPLGVPAKMPPFNDTFYNRFAFKGRGGLDAYELGVYFVWALPAAHNMMAPSPSIDWAFWAQDTAQFLVAVADTDYSGSVSAAEAAATFGLGPNQFVMLAAPGGNATAASISAVLGNFGSVLFGEGLVPGVDGSALAGLVVQLFDHSGDMALNSWETRPLRLDLSVFAAMDFDKNGLIEAVELRDFMNVFGENPCGGYIELHGTAVSISAQVPFLARNCTWLINPQWHYDVAIDNPNSTVLKVAKDLFGYVAPTAGLRSASKNTPSEYNLLTKAEGDMTAQAAARRLQSILPTVQKGSMVVRAVGAPAVANEFPFAASIIDSGAVRRCGGALVDEIYVLTSASCIMSLGGAAAAMLGTVKVGGLSVADPAAETRTIVGVHVHPAYEIDHTNDVALVMLSSPSAADPAELYGGGDVGFDDCHKMQISALSMLAGGTLRKKMVTAVPQQACADMYLWTYGSAAAIAPDVLCVQGEVSSCDSTNDLGGPLVARTPAGRMMLLGVGASVGVCDTLPVAYTRVSEVMQWVLAAGEGMGVHPATKLLVRVEDLNLPMGGTLSVYAHATTDHPHALHLDSKCQAGAAADDMGAGALVVRYTPPAMGLLSGVGACDSTCLSAFRFRLSVAPLSCEANFAAGDGSPASCTDPAVGGLNSSAGGVRGCAYSPAQSGLPPRCASPACALSVGWPQLGPMEVMGKAYTGGLGHKMVKTAAHEFGVWACVRDWDEGEQLVCGAEPLELACFWFDEVARQWAPKGTNEQARLVEQSRYFHGLDVEETLLATNILLPEPRKDGLMA